MRGKQFRVPVVALAWLLSLVLVAVVVAPARALDSWAGWIAATAGNEAATATGARSSVPQSASGAKITDVSFVTLGNVELLKLTVRNDGQTAAHPVGTLQVAQGDTVRRLPIVLGAINAGTERDCLLPLTPVHYAPGTYDVDVFLSGDGVVPATSWVGTLALDVSSAASTSSTPNVAGGATASSLVRALSGRGLLSLLILVWLAVAFGVVIRRNRRGLSDLSTRIRLAVASSLNSPIRHAPARLAVGDSRVVLRRRLK